MNTKPQSTTGNEHFDAAMRSRDRLIDSLPANQLAVEAAACKIAELEQRLKDRDHAFEQLLEACKAAYLFALGTAPDSHRIRNQTALCQIRDAIAEATGQDSQTVQECFENKLQSALDCPACAGTQINHSQFCPTAEPFTH